MKNQPGKITRQEDGFKVVFERILDHNILTVWEVITNPEKLKFWFTDFEIDFRTGGKIKIINRDQDRTATYGEIVKIDRPNRFEYTWEGDLAVWELFPLGENKCKLRLTYGKIDQNYVDRTPVGWHILLNRLEKMLGGSREILPFGEEEGNSPEFQRVKKEYDQIIYSSFPELKGLKLKNF